MFGEKQAAYYRQLAQMLEVGVSPVRAFETLGRAFPGRYGRLSLVMREVIERGGTMEDALRAVPQMVDPLAVKLIAAGARSGRVHEVLVRVAEGIEANARLFKSMLTRLLYPVLIFHLAVGIMMLVILFLKKSVVLALLFALSTLGPAYGFLLLLWVLWRLRRSIGVLEVVIDHTCYYVPLVGGVVRNLALARFCRTFESLYSAGVHMAEGIGVAADACGNRLMRERLRLAIASLKEGNGLEVALPRTGAFDPTVQSMLLTGAETGKMHVMLAKVAETAQFNAEQSIDRMGRVIPLLIYLLIMGFIVTMIIVVLMTYVSMLTGSGLL